MKHANNTTQQPIIIVIQALQIVRKLHLSRALSEAVVAGSARVAVCAEPCPTTERT